MHHPEQFNGSRAIWREDHNSSVLTPHSYRPARLLTGFHTVQYFRPCCSRYTWAIYQQCYTRHLESYVDDTKVFMFFSIKDIATAKQTLEEDLKRIAQWYLTNQLLINPDKTKFLLMGTYQLLQRLATIWTSWAQSLSRILQRKIWASLLTSIYHTIPASPTWFLLAWPNFVK